jgi:glycosyltransferase involved in cell wall biosynthesis
MRVALVHDWMTGMRGGEYVFEAIAELFPKAELFTLLYVPASVSPTITVLKRHTSPLQKMPGAEKRYRSFLPLMPRWIEGFDLSEFDLVISSSHCVAKGVRKAPDAVHVSYVHAPMRYMWDRFDDYFGPGRASPPVRLAATLLRKRFQDWDRRVSQPDRVDELIANSKYIADQIEAAYGRKAQVIYPFSDFTRFSRQRSPGKGYLMVGAFAPNKRVEIAVEAFNRLKLPLFIVGGGQNKNRIAKLAGPTVELLGNLSNDAIADLYSKCKAFVFPGKEDFGITPLEAMAAGAPVIAFGEGGVIESVKRLKH